MIEQYKTTSIKCEECGGPVVMDIFKEELYCLDCGLIHLDNVPEDINIFEEGR